jgi:aspartate/methionine/tyrosine aminotransferase
LGHCQGDPQPGILKKSLAAEGTHMPVIPEFRLEAYMSKWEFNSRFHLTASDAESLSVRDLLQLANEADREAFANAQLGYLPPAGSAALREAIASTYESVSANDVLCFAGGGEAIFAAVNTLLDTGDHAVIITPSYQSAETLAVCRCATTGVALDPDNNWELYPDSVLRAIRPNTRLVAINFPNNPTGKIVDRATYDELIEICRRHGLWLLSDEVFTLVERDPAMRLPQAVDAYERGISINVMSKSYGLPGLRVGWIAAKDDGLLARMEKLKHYLSICNSSTGEALAVIALTSRDAILKRTRAIVRSNVALLESFFAEFPELFEWREPDGGTVAYPRYKGAAGVETFVRRLAEDAGVLLMPASVFRSDLNPTPADRFRIGLGRANMTAGLDAMRGWLKEHIDEV